MSSSESIRDRVKELRRVPAGDLRANPKNWRTHPDAQRKALSGVLETVGFADAVLARELPDGSLELIDGHLRAEELPPDYQVPVLVLDVTEDEADTILATHDPLAAMAHFDATKLDELLHSIECEHMMPAAHADRITGTVLTKETPYSPDDPSAYEYPFPDAVNAALYSKYRARVEATERLVVAGRLGEYRYYDMDQAIGRAQRIADKMTA